MGLKAVCLLGKHSVTELIPSPITPLSNTVPPLLFEGHEFTVLLHITLFFLSLSFFLSFSALCFWGANLDPQASQASSLPPSCTPAALLACLDAHSVPS